MIGLFDPWIDDPFDHKPEQVRLKPLLLTEALDRFLTAKRASGRRETTLRTYRHIIGLFCSDLNGRQTSTVTKTEVERSIRHPDVASSTRYTRYRHMKAFFTWCVEHRLAKTSPVDGIEAPDNSHRLPKAMSKVDLDAICKAIEINYAEKIETGKCREPF